MKRIGLFHATLAAIPAAESAWHAADQPVSLIHYLDEGLLGHVRRHGLEETTRRRLRCWLELISGDGVDAIMTTCSSLSPLIADLRPHIVRPIVAIDDAMIEQALAGGPRIGIVATLASAAETTRGLLSASPGASALTLTTRIAHGAFEALGCGKMEDHDRTVRDAVVELAGESDVIVLAQLSMARALPLIKGLPIPVLTSGPGAVQRTLKAAQDAGVRPRS